MIPLMEGYRSQVLASTYGGVAPRWVLIDAEPRPSQAQRTVDTQLLTQGDQEINAFQQLCRTAFACQADAQQALATFAPRLKATLVHESTVRQRPRYGQRGRPGPGVHPKQMVYHLAGALASRRAARPALVDPHGCLILATHALDDAPLSPQALLEGDKGQGHAERGFRFLKDPPFLAASCYLKKPARMMALLMVMTVCLLVYAALEYRIRQALREHDPTFPHQTGKPVQNPTARWVFHDFVGMHLLYLPGQWPFVRNLLEEHQPLRRLLGDRYAWFYR